MVGDAITILKNMSQWEGLIIPNMKWNMKFMFETTNQLYDICMISISVKKITDCTVAIQGCSSHIHQGIITSDGVVPCLKQRHCSETTR